MYEPHPQSQRQYTKEQKEDVAREYVLCVAEKVRIFESLTDTVSADAAEGKLEALNERIDALYPVFSYVSGEDVDTAMQQERLSPSALKNETLRLMEADFYGSATLKSYCNNH